MAYIHLSSKEIEEIKQLKAVNGREGDYGKCYFYNKDNADFQKLFKLFYPPGCEDELHFAGINSDYIGFPINIYYNDEKTIIGYTVRYFSGRNLFFSFPFKVDIEKLKLAYFQALATINQYPYINMKDLEFYNIMYDNKSNAFYFIDTDKWQPTDNGVLNNSLNFGRQIMFVFTTLFLRWRDYPLNMVSDLRELYKEYIYNFSRPDIFTDFLDVLTQEVSKQKGQKVKTIGELSKI